VTPECSDEKNDYSWIQGNRGVESMAEPQNPNFIEELRASFARQQMKALIGASPGTPNQINKRVPVRSPTSPICV
jgi:hypothetical protein